MEKALIKKYIFIFLFFFMVPSGAYAKIYHYTLLEKTRGAAIIVLAKNLSIKDEQYESDSTALPRFSDYRIIEVWKGIYDKDTMLLDFKLTNDKYKPFICRPATNPVSDELVVLFIENDFSIFAGFQGKTVVEPDVVSLYKDAVEKFLEFDKLGGKEKVPLTLKMIEDGNPHVRESMMRELYNIDKTANGIEIAGLLKNKDVSVRRSAIGVLAGTEDRRTVPFVLLALKDPDSKVRAGAASVLRSLDLDDERIPSALIEAYNDNDAGVRVQVIFSLSLRNGGKAIPIYLNALHDEDPGVREAGVAAFASARQLNAIPEILYALKDKSERVRASAIRSLYVYIRTGTIEPEAGIMNSVSSLLADADPRVRAEAATFFAEIGWQGHGILIDEKIINDLIHTVESDSNNEVKRSTLVALRAIASPRAIPIMLYLLSDVQSNIRAEAADTLSNIGNKTIIPQMEEALKKEQDGFVREKLKHALERLKGI